MFLLFWFVPEATMPLSALLLFFLFARIVYLRDAGR